MTVFNVAGYLIEEKSRLPIITASPQGQYSKLIQNFERKAHSDEKTVPVAWLAIISILISRFILLHRRLVGDVSASENYIEIASRRKACNSCQIICCAPNRQLVDCDVSMAN